MGGGLAGSQVTAQTKHSRSALAARVHKKGFQAGVSLKTSKLVDFSHFLFEFGTEMIRRACPLVAGHCCVRLAAVSVRAGGEVFCR